MAQYVSARHRAPGRFNPLSELSAIVTAAASPAVKTTAVLAASGGLVAAFALPAQAAPAVRAAPSTTATAASAPAAVSAPQAAPVAGASFGVIGFTATAKPKPKPKPKPAPKPKPVVVAQRAVQQVSRSTTRTATRPATRTKRVVSSKATAKSYTSLKPAAGGVLGIAAQYAGLMYRYGGTSPSTGFDCSGYTQYVFAKVGISLPRTAEAQRQAVTPVSNPQPGDLVFFGAPAYHMGIYAGGGMMWDSPRTGKAVSKRSIYSGNVTYGRP